MQLLIVALGCVAATLARADVAEVRKAADAWAEGWSRGDIERLVQLYSSDAVIVSPLTGLRFEGPHGVRAYLRRAVGAAPKAVVQARAFRAYGDAVVQNETWHLDPTVETPQAGAVLYRRTEVGWAIADHRPAVGPEPMPATGAHSASRPIASCGVDGCP